MISSTPTIILALSVTLISSSLSLPARAQSEADQEACTPDVFRLCQAYIPNEGPIVACLQASRAQLSPACHRVIFPPSEAAAAQPATPHRRHAARHHRRHTDGK